MYILLYLVKTTLCFAIDVVIIMMFIHAIMSWISPDNDSRIMIFISNVVDVVVSPVRAILSRFEALRSFPLDISFTVTWLLLILLQYGIAAL